MSYQTVSEALGKWVNKPFKKLPRDRQPYATAHIPKWDELTPKERTDRAIEVDRQRGVKSRLRHDRATRTQQAACDPVQEAVGWHNVTLEADHWAALGDIAPIDAAMLLCRFNPNETSLDDARRTTTDELGPEHFVRLAQRLADIDKADHKPRTLRDWHQTARGMGLVYHSWIDGYMEATRPPALPVVDTATAAPVAVAASVEPAKAAPVKAGLLTREIADIFDGINGWDSKRWTKNLSSSKWLHPARTGLGGAGVASSVWNPLTLAQLIHAREKGSRPREQLMKTLNSRFDRNAVLMPWRDDCNEYFATFCTAD